MEFNHDLANIFNGLKNNKNLRAKAETQTKKEETQKEKELLSSEQKNIKTGDFDEKDFLGGTVNISGKNKIESDKNEIKKEETNNQTANKKVIANKQQNIAAANTSAQLSALKKLQNTLKTKNTVKTQTAQNTENKKMK